MGHMTYMGQVIEYAQYLGIDPLKEPHLLSTPKKVFVTKLN